MCLGINFAESFEVHWGRLGIAVAHTLRANHWLHRAALPWGRPRRDDGALLGPGAGPGPGAERTQGRHGCSLGVDNPRSVPRIRDHGGDGAGRPGRKRGGPVEQEGQIVQTLIGDRHLG